MDSDGNPLNGSYDFTFSVFDVESGGIAIWTETQNGLNVAQGIFQVGLGAVTPIDIDFNGTFWLEIAIDGEILSPRQLLTSIGQAYQAQDVLKRDIHPNSISIDEYGEVITSEGVWVGEPSGLIGPTGPQGEQGLQGPEGPMGLQGPTGPQGEQGLQGPEGPMGQQGPTGPQGEQGLQGPEGPMGQQGPTGPQGEQGLQGPEGPMGQQGPTGPQGEQGLQGPEGPMGLQGPTGPQGEQGLQGPEGPMGLQGPTGPQGEQGLQGPEGPMGLMGPEGPAGPQGERGPTGPIAGSDNQLIYNNAGSSAGANVYYDDTTGNLGVGTDTPVTRLDVAGHTRSSGWIYSDTALATGGTGPGGDYPDGDFWGQYQDAEGDYHFFRTGWDPIVEYKRADNNVNFNVGTGKVGINNNTPTAKLDVTGDARISSSFSAPSSVRTYYDRAAAWTNTSTSDTFITVITRSLTLAAPTYVTVFGYGHGYPTSASYPLDVVVFFDGVMFDATNDNFGWGTAISHNTNNWIPITAVASTLLPAGSHTIDLKFHCRDCSGNSAYFNGPVMITMLNGSP